MNNNSDPFNIIKNFIKQQGSPKELLINFMQRNNQNSMLNNLINMAKKGNTQEVEQFARNVCKEKNINFDIEFSNFMKNFKG